MPLLTALIIVAIVLAICLGLLVLAARYERKRRAQMDAEFDEVVPIDRAVVVPRNHADPLDGLRDVRGPMFAVPIRSTVLDETPDPTASSEPRERDNPPVTKDPHAGMGETEIQPPKEG
jgi:hypothetical protein